MQTYKHPFPNSFGLLKLKRAVGIHVTGLEVRSYPHVSPPLFYLLNYHFHVLFSTQGWCLCSSSGIGSRIPGAWEKPDSQARP